MKLLDRYTHFSFDLDGTLVHTLPEYRLFVVPKVVKACGGRIQDKHDIDRFWFESGRDRIIRQRFGIAPDTFWDAFHRLDDPAVRAGKYTFPYPDAAPTLTMLRAAGKKISVITGAVDILAELELQRLKGAPYDFYISVTSSTCPPKPHPASIELALERAHSTPNETVYIGNSNEDAYYAKNAQVGFVYLQREEQHDTPYRTDALARICSLEELLTLDIT